MAQQNTGVSFFTLEVLQLTALPPRGGFQWAGGHSGQEPTLELGPHPQDAYTQGPEAVISQPELNADSGVNLNQTLPHDGLGRQYFFGGNQLISSWKSARQGRYKGKDGKPRGTNDFCSSHAMAVPSQYLLCWREVGSTSLQAGCATGEEQL